MLIIATFLLFLSPLDQAHQAVRQLPECRPILDQIEREGGYQVIENRSAPFTAQWNPNRRTIEVNSQSHENVGRIIVSILFEMHNALGNSRLTHLQDLARSRRLPKKLFVRKMEQKEWKNWESTCALLAIGREKGIFPQTATAKSFRSFANYLDIQERSGHTEYHAYHYNLL